MAENNVKVLDREEVPEKKRSGKERLFEHFRRLTRDKALEFKLSDFQLSLSGFRYVIREWNMQEEEKLDYVQKSGTIYVYTVLKPKEKKIERAHLRKPQ